MAVLYIRNSSGEFEGVQSLNGKTAYQAAKEGGYTGTESEFNAKLAQEIPTALPNPQPITINGQRYDGSEAVTVTTVEIDDTMTQSGKAADAKAVGDQLNALNEANAKLKDDVAAITPDDTVVDGKPWSSKNAVDALCMPIEVTGNLAQVYPVEGYPLGVKVSWEPTHEGSGDPSPDNIRPISGRDAVSVTRCRKNLIKTQGIKYPASEQSYYFLYHDGAVKSEFPFYLVAGITYTYTVEFADNIDSMFYTTFIARKNSANIEFRGVLSGAKYVSKIQVEETGYYDIWHWNDKDYDVSKYKNSQLELGSTPTAYEPYTGSTTNIALPETVYGGTLDMETGVVTVEYGHIASYAGESLPGDWISDRDVYAPDATPTTGAQVVYKLKTPYTIHLTEHQIAALSGVNTLYTDAGTLTVTGREDPRHTIVELKNAIISLGGNI